MLIPLDKKVLTKQRYERRAHLPSVTRDASALVISTLEGGMGRFNKAAVDEFGLAIGGYLLVFYDTDTTRFILRKASRQDKDALKIFSSGPAALLCARRIMAVLQAYLPRFANARRVTVYLEEGDGTLMTTPADTWGVDYYEQ